MSKNNTMKNNILFALTVCLSGLATLQAQDFSKHAIGLRLGNGYGFGTEVSYQRALSDTNRLEVDLGAYGNNSTFKLTGIYQWVWELEGNFNWYAGAGAGLGTNDLETFIYGAGQVGIEYHFDIPLQLFIDSRPEISFRDYGDNLNIGISIGARYKF